MSKTAQWWHPEPDAGEPVTAWFRSADDAAVLDGRSVAIRSLELPGVGVGYVIGELSVHHDELAGTWCTDSDAADLSDIVPPFRDARTGFTTAEEAMMATDAAYARWADGVVASRKEAA